MNVIPLALPIAGYTLRVQRGSDASAFLAYQLGNRERLRPWEPARDESFYTTASLQKRLADFEEQTAAGMALHLFTVRDQDQAIVGECNFTNIVRGPFQACYLGFSVDANEEGTGLMFNALQSSIRYVFEELKLHRVMANYRPENTRSAALLGRLGFEREGLAKRYLKINGVWADHVLTSLLNHAE